MNREDFLRPITVENQTYWIYDIRRLEDKVATISSLPFSIRTLVENLLRNMDGTIVTDTDLINISRWKGRYDKPIDIPYFPARILMQDFTGVPAVVDLASMREVIEKMGRDPEIINPLVPTELVIDHSIQVDYYGFKDSIHKNVEMEYQRNQERYELLKWAQNNLDNFKVVPPNSGICHQVNLEYLSRLMITEPQADKMIAFPDTLIGTDSHTTMINGIGVLGWGVGGIEAEAVMLGLPYYMTIPEVVGVKMTNSPSDLITATDIVLTVTELLRKHDVVEKFVEFFGPGVANLNVADRATIANMAPEYGATIGFFPIDDKTIEYMALTGRDHQAVVVETISKALGLFSMHDDDPFMSEVIELDLSAVQPSIAGPSRPQDRIHLWELKSDLKSVIDRKQPDNKPSEIVHDDCVSTTISNTIIKEPRHNFSHQLGIKDGELKIKDGSIVIAAITSCTNTSNPHAMIGAGLSAKKAVEAGLRISPFIKASIFPGSRTVHDYLTDAGLLSYLEALGFFISGYGCSTCIGNSGPLNPEINDLISEKNLNVAAVLSGNRNFEARIHQKVRLNFLMSPMLVIAFALAGRIDIDLENEPLGFNINYLPVYLKDIRPDKDEIHALVEKHVDQDCFISSYQNIFEGDTYWKRLTAPRHRTFQWRSQSTYIKNPPYFEHFSLEPPEITGIQKARVLAVLGDSVTTDHISPAGAIPENYPAGKYLLENKVVSCDFNTYGSRRGNDEVMTRGTFGNIRIKNRLIAPQEGGFTLKFPEKEKMYIFDAARAYKEEQVPLIILAGKEYGTGSSRDWAAKGTKLLGVKAVIAQSFERIHRSNLVGMGVLPLVFKKGESVDRLGLDGSEVFTIDLPERIEPGAVLTVIAAKPNKREIAFSVTLRLDSEIEVDYFLHGGILPYVVRKLLS